MNKNPVDILIHHDDLRVQLKMCCFSVVFGIWSDNAEDGGRSASVSGLEFSVILTSPFF